MGDILDKFVNETSLTVENVRKLVDDYSLISHYLGEELELFKYALMGDDNPLSQFFSMMV